MACAQETGRDKVRSRTLLHSGAVSIYSYHVAWLNENCLVSMDLIVLHCILASSVDPLAKALHRLL